MPPSPFSRSPSAPGADVSDLRTATLSRSSKKITNKSINLTPTISPISPTPPVATGTGAGASIRPSSSPVETLIVDEETPYDSSDHPPRFIDGISIDTESSSVRVSASTREDTVSILQDATDDETKRKIIDSGIGAPPEILSSIRLPFLEYTSEEIDDSIEVGQFERQILKETLLQGLSQVSSKDPSGLYTQAKKDLKRRQDLIQKQTESISDMMSAASSAATGLNILKMSPQIMQRASESIKPLLFESEKFKKNPEESLPAEIDDYIRLTYPGIESVDEKLTNTSRLILIMQDMLVSALSCHPSLFTDFSRDSETKSIFSIAEKIRYSTDPFSDSSIIPTIDKVFSQNRNSILSAFSDTRVGFREKTGLLKDGSYSNSRQNLDIIIHLITCLSNELIISSGIGKLIGSQIGNIFLQSSSTNSRQYAPFDRVFGESPTASAENISRFFRSGIGRSSSFQGSFLDYMALGEETVGRDFIVMPFEVDTVIDDTGTPYAAGKKYFIDLAIQEVNNPIGVQPKRDALKSFSNDYKKFTNNSIDYMSQLLSLDSDTKLSPQTLYIRILQDFREILRSMSSGIRNNGDRSNIKSLTAASLFSVIDSGIMQSSIDTSLGSAVGVTTYSFESTSLGRTRRDFVSSRPERFVGPVSVSSRDVLKMSVIEAYKQLSVISPDNISSLAPASISFYSNSEEDSSDEESLVRETIENIITKNLAASWKIMSNRSTKGVQFVSEEGENIQYSSLTSELELLHDNEFDVKDNIVNLIAKFLREIQKETYKNSRSDGLNASYINSRGNTFMSDCNIDRLIDVVCEIYIRLSSILLPFTFSVGQDDFGRPASYNEGFICKIDITKSQQMEKLLDIVIQSIKSGQRVNSQNFENLVGISSSTYMGASVTTTNNNFIRIDDLISFSNRFVNHRFYIKSSLKILESISQCVSSSSARLSRTFDILKGSLRREDLNENEKTLFDMFVTNISKNRQFLSRLNEYQANLCTASRFTQVSENPVFLRRDLDTTRSERLAVRDFIRALKESKLEGSISGDNLHLITVGLPPGMISALTSTVFGRDTPVVSDFRLGSSGNEALNSRPTISIDVYRHDQSRVTIESSGISVIKGNEGDRHTLYDPEIFVLPDSVSYNPSTLESSDDPAQNSPSSLLQKILFSTKFYRIRSGKVIETINPDSSTPTDQITLLRNALVSYLLDLYMYDTLRVRYNDCLGVLGPNSVSQSGYSLINEISNSPELSLLVMNRPGFSKLIDPVSLRMKTGIDLLEMITRRNRFTDPEFTLDNYKIASILSSMNIMSDTDYVFQSRNYERIYHFLYDEKKFQNTITNSQERERRKKFDVFTLSAAVSHIG